MRAVLEAYRQQIIVKRLNLKPMFQDFDVTRCGHVSKTQFLRVLNQFNIFVSEAVMALLLKKYMDKGNTDEVNYFEFCNDVDRPEDLFGAGRDFNTSFDYFPRMQPKNYSLKEIVSSKPNDLDDLLARIRAECKEKRIRLSEFFRDFDRLRSGEVTFAQMRIAINMGKIHLSTNEFDLLTQRFAGKKEGFVNWRDFDDAIEEAFTTKHLEKTVDAEAGLGRTKTFYGAPEAKDLHKHNAVAHVIMSRFRQLLVRERLDAKSFFQTWDRHNHYKVTPKQFRQVLASFNFIMSDEELQAVKMVFGDANGDIKYLEFLQRTSPDESLNAGAQKTTYKAQFR